MFNYQIQNSNQTLADGIAEFYAVHAQQIQTREPSAEAQEFFRCHDVAHVVFGCDVSLADELVVKISSMFGTSAGIGVLKGYRLPESKETYEKISFGSIVVTAAKALFLIPRTLFRCFKMHKRWQWDAFESHLNQPLKLIREEFGVVVAGS
ncbi:MAG: hypothetical protein AB8G18_16150 [Gammaproteobacteria bacterium]